MLAWTRIPGHIGIVVNILPVIARELRVAARKPKVYKTRLAVACSVTLVTGVAVTLMSAAGFNTGGAIFKTLAGAIFFLSLAGGAEATADTISEEKREGTLGLLFLTPLHGLDIVQGKLVAASLTTFYNVLGVFPVLSLLIIFGGIELTAFFRMLLSVINAMLLSAAIGIFASSISRLRKRASGAAAMLLVFFWIVAPALAQIFRSIGRLPLARLIESVCPSQSFQSALSTGFGFTTDPFWESLLGTHLVAWGFLVAAGWIVPRTWQDKPPSQPSLTWREKIKQFTYGNTALRTRRRKRLLEINPFLWLSFRARYRAVLPWIFLAGVFGLNLFIAIKFREDRDEVLAFAASSLLICNLVFKLWVGGTAAEFIAEEKASGALEWLLSTPLSVPQIIRGQMLALRQQFLWPVVSLLGVETCLWVAGAVGALADREKLPLALWVVCGAGFLSCFILDLVTLAWVGLWSGISAKDRRRVSGAAAIQVLVLPSLVFALGSAIIGISVAYRFISEPNQWWAVGGWFGLGLITDGIWLRVAPLLLNRRMRAFSSPWVKAD